MTVVKSKKLLCILMMFILALSFGIPAIADLPDDGQEQPGEDSGTQPGDDQEQPGDDQEQPGDEPVTQPGDDQEQSGDEQGTQPDEDQEQPGEESGTQPGEDQEQLGEEPDTQPDDEQEQPGDEPGDTQSGGGGVVPIDPTDEIPVYVQAPVPQFKFTGGSGVATAVINAETPTAIKLISVSGIPSTVNIDIFAGGKVASIRGSDIEMSEAFTVSGSQELEFHLSGYGNLTGAALNFAIQ
jgi:hypothetical protein